MQIVGGVVKFMQNVAKCEMAHSEFNGHQNVVDNTPAAPPPPPPVLSPNDADIRIRK